MEASSGMVAGSHKRNELVRIRHDSSDSGPKPLKNLNGQICQICGENVGLTATSDVFVACNECGFPVCRPCYEYERKDGNQSCPQCKTRYKRHKGSPRVDGDDDEDDGDDIENEFSYGQGNTKSRRQWEDDAELSSSSRRDYQQPIPLLTNGQTMSGEIPCATPDTQSIRTTSGPLGPSEKGHALPYIDPRQPVPVRIVDPSKDLNSYGLGNVDWKERVEGWKLKHEKNMVQMTGRYAEGKGGGGDIEGTGSNGEELQMVDDARQPMSRIVPISSSQLTPYRVVIVLRLIILGFFLQYRVTHPVNDAYPLWLTSVICEIWFALSWILDQFPKWSPINRETYLDRLAIRYDRDGEPSQLAPVDVFVSTVDPLKEPPLVTANTVLSILSVDYPVDKVSCYVSDDGSAMLTFEALSETAEFAKKWVPFCKKHNIEPRAPEFYFAQKIDYLKDKIQPSFVKERRAMKREYEEFKVGINAYVAKAQKTPEEGWTMQDGTPWPGNNSRDHPGMIQVFLGHSGGLDTDGNELPRLVYVSREKRPGFQHHKKAGAMNALIRVSAVLTNGAYLLNVDCDHYFNNSKALKEAMCFMMDPTYAKKTCYVQFPQRFDGIDLHDRYANRNIVFFDINMKGHDGIQGPVYVGTGCCFNRQALYGYDPVLTEEDLEPNIIVKSCCGSRKKGRGGNKKYGDKKRGVKRTESTIPIRFLFVLGITHVLYSVVAVGLAMSKIYSWCRWENQATMAIIDGNVPGKKNKVMRRQTTFVFHHTSHPWSRNPILIWMLCFLRQFRSSIQKSDYLALRLGFITEHKLPLSYDFHKYMVRSMEDEFHGILGISCPLWIYTIVCIFVNIHGLNIYFWFSFIPAILVMVIGTKLQHVVSTLALEVWQHQGPSASTQVKPRDALFWFNKPDILLWLIQFVIFQNAFEMASFIWTLWGFKQQSCFMRHHYMIVIRLTSGILVQFWCSYMTVPLNIIVSQMGSRCKKALVTESVRESLHSWCKRVKQKSRHDHSLRSHTARSICSLESTIDERDEITVVSGTLSRTTSLDLESLNQMTVTSVDQLNFMTSNNLHNSHYNGAGDRDETKVETLLDLFHKT